MSTDPHCTIWQSRNKKSKTHEPYLSDFRDPHPEKVSLIMENSTCHSGYVLIIISNSKGSVALGLVYNSWELNFNLPCLLSLASIQPFDRIIGSLQPKQNLQNYCCHLFTKLMNFALKYIDVNIILKLF